MKRLMTHVVVGNPDLDTTKRLIKAMISRNIAAIELQIPFSDPIADGPVLVEANNLARSQNITTRDALNLVEEIDHGSTKMLIMTYLQPIFHYGPKQFFERAIKAGCKGLIVPDLPFDAPETGSYIKVMPSLRRLLIPVLSPSMPQDRIDKIFEILDPDLVYLTARHGITGEHSQFGNVLKKTVQQIRSKSTAQIAIGFGIQTPQDVCRVLDLADQAVVGTALTVALNQSEQAALTLLDQLCAEA